MNKIVTLIEKIKSPDREFSPVPFWFLNAELSDGEIIRQLEEFNAKGVHGVVLHPRLGLPESIEYLSDTYMHYIETAIKTCARLDMTVVLYDEAMYPSGSAHGLVVKENPKFAAQAILLEDAPDDGKTYFNLSLKRRESVLILEGAVDFPLEKEKIYADIEFVFTHEDGFAKYYKGTLAGTKDGLYIKINAEEMLECFINGNFAGVSFWNDHEFYVSPYLNDGENIIELKVSGSAANKYSNAKIEYGLI